jgi:RHS repeat-associated protein
MPNRHGYTGTKYRYGFQDQEVDDELKGEDNSVNFEFRMHDPRIGRFFAVDPLTKEYPHYTPYSFAGNKGVGYRDREGLEEEAAAVFFGPAGWTYIAVKWGGLAVIGVVTYYQTQELVNEFKNAPSLPVAKRTVEAQPAQAKEPREDTKGKPKPEPKPEPIVPSPDGTTEEKEKDDPKFIYRAGANTDVTFTPGEKDLDPGKYKLPGLSTFTTPEAAAQGKKGQKVQKLSVEVLRKQGMTVVFDGGGHVTVTTTNNNNLTSWAKSKNGLIRGVLGQLKAHYLTRKVSSSRVGEVKT